MDQPDSPLMPEASHPEAPQPETPQPEAVVVSPPLRPSPARGIFFGPQGLRAGWRLLIYLAVMFLLMMAAGGIVVVVLRKAHVARGFLPAAMIAQELAFFLPALAASAIMARIERRRIADYGLPKQGAFGVRFWEGAAWGFLGLSLLLAILKATGSFSYGTVAVHGAAFAKYAALYGVVFLLVGFAEEYAFRGYSLFTLSTGMRFWPAALLLSALFGAVHLGNPGETWFGGFMAGFIGLFFCLTLRRTGSLWFAIGMHMGWDWGETFFYGVPDSGMSAPGHFLNPAFHGPKWLTGGTVGPEASLICLLVIVLCFILFDRRFPRAVKFPVVRQPAPEQAVSIAGPVIG